MASGAEGLAGLSALSGGGGPAAQPARTPTATNSTENRFMIPCRDEFSKTELDFHWAEILDASLDRLPGRCRDSNRNEREPAPVSCTLRGGEYH
jgi:hypothetical protein